MKFCKDNNFLFLKKKIIILISYVLAHIININLYFINLTKKKFYYNHSLGFGDSFIYYLRNFQKIKKTNNYALSFGNITSKSINFFFLKKKIKNILIPIPKLVYYEVVNKLIKLKNFKPILFGDVYEETQFNNTIYYKNIILDCLKKFKLNQKIRDFKKKKYVCIFIKHYNNNIKNLSGAAIRQTANLEPIKKIIFFFLKKKITLMILGLKNEKSVNEIKQFAQKNNLIKNIYFLNTLSKNYSIEDQIFIANNSIGYIGSTSGPASLFYFLRKKMLLINCPDDKEIPHCKNRKREKKFIKYLYKKIKYKNRKIKLKKNYINIKNSVIYENTYEEIKKFVKNFLIKNK